MKKTLLKLSAAAIAFTFVLGGFNAATTPKASATVLALILYEMQAAEKVADSLPKDLKKDDWTVDLGKFKDKYGNTPLTKNAGEFKYGKWSVEKDTAGHIGWNGNPKKWKLKKDGKRKASLDKDGVVLGE
ncbi:hypothetical protein [Brevibacillus thermoruber]|jgi:hypothetical protein|uniref:hypothetical protein n=1 Tax=Brevibacillus thermoruber TaxID=33942 RepID=UPI000558E4F6|nr:hypothetical protein [Brevibacillus thermoruber]